MKLSVIIPVYNKEMYLCQCLDSVLNQGLDEFEIIAIDDGSTDSSGLILDGYAEKDVRVKVIHQQNRGVGSARNTGLAATVGEYILFLDADDFLYDQKLAPAVEFAYASNADMVEFCSDIYQHQTGEIIIPTEIFYADRPPIGHPFSWRDDPEFFALKFKICVHSKIFRRSFLKESGIQFTSLRNCEDYVYLLSLMLLADRIVLSDIKLMLYRIGTGTSIEDTLDKAPLCRIESTLLLHDFAASLPFYNQVKRGVCSMNAIMNTSFLTTCKSAAVFREYYATLKNGALEKLELTGLKRGYIPSPASDSAIRRILRGNPIMPKLARRLTVWKALTFPVAYSRAIFSAFRTGGSKEVFRRIRISKSRIGE
ncbi:MAG TPA: glycosyltransferase family 2 protein [Oscillospiraceae bacterium]|nr:glycosyltransferase family 2 protein [Oscillospiraceae bacterium]HPF57064.1 glycosyltransferase family 2 protein [Clostridiales bacterium]HPK34717.1 glycosyltransferase family 2 protein [Oscillospiraceae bacterium]HPR74519.1 glycosyltransferase family 2 protein [Oscillospiraceae bacterium]